MAPVRIDRPSTAEGDLSLLRHVNIKIIVLFVLARSPSRRLSMDEIRHQVKNVIELGDFVPETEWATKLHDVDIFEAGLVSRDYAGLQITDRGLSLLRPSNASSTDLVSSAALQTIDDSIGSSERFRTFELELMRLDESVDRSITARRGRKPPRTHEARVIKSLSVIAEMAEGLSKTVESADMTHSLDRRAPVPTGTLRIERAVQAIEQEESFPQARFGSKALAPKPTPLTTVVSHLFSSQGPRHLTLSQPTPANSARDRGNVPIALLAFLAFMACGVAAIALGQFKALKSDFALEHRDLLYLRERMAKVEQVQKANLAQEQAETQRRIGIESKTKGEDQAALNLTQDEIQMIKEYIKPAASGSNGAPMASVGDLVAGTTIPLPSALTDKLPRLLGARFTIQNGVIIVIKRESHQAGAILVPN